MNLAGRSGPSGPKVELQLPFYGASGIDGTVPGTYYVLVGGSLAVLDASGVEDASGYFVPQRGTLGTFLVQNVALGADAVNVTYRVRRNGSPVGPAAILGNNAAGPMRIDLSAVGLSPGDLVTVQTVIPAFGGEPPVPKIGMTWFPRG